MRELTPYETEVFERLFQCDFPGRDALVRQLSGLQVRQLDNSGCLELQPRTKYRAAVEHRIPIEATYPDSDGILAHVDLHVVDGLLFGLEYYKEDGSAVTYHPPTKDLSLFSPTGGEPA